MVHTNTTEYLSRSRALSFSKRCFNSASFMVNFRFWRKRAVPEEDPILGTPQESTVPREVNLIYDHDGEASEIIATPLKFAEGPGTDKEVGGGATSEAKPVLGDEKEVTDVNQCIEKIGFGRYQWKVILVMGMMSFADSCEIWLSSVIISKTTIV